ncbi:hypothetical protein Fleli_0378 [Bernardetia litoralis DSM 6794]|uniref:Uncharacterized protein n=1 Tax=Bernardetia litoralis (strain ATCC 23117 / DSM 6794 / NBRC 15988 / NCIMB 1366 / Fx l1 / Sio-4) TaxID=880071 RepID=I4AFX3_BERLS|nr:hypothetical protein [Bernardetia litoralis]AFM02858.1 hypothetical protein Fleli_0378 [Bernardetia litoralis DSM 6794]
MSYHSHKIDSTHSHIIGRTDSVTGDTIKENDSIVFCLNCHSCFLEESWNYMNDNHCQQKQTLSFVPLPPPQLIAKKKAQKLIAELTDSMINPSLITIPSFVFGFIGYHLTVSDKISFTVIGVALGIFLGILIGTLTKTKKFKEFTGIGGEKISIYENYIETKNTKFFWNEIEQINFKRTMRIEYNKQHGTEKAYSHTPSLRIILKDGKFTEIKLPTKNYPHIKPFLFGLVWASQFVSVYFYTEHEKEYGLIKSFDRNYQGTIKIGEPKQLVYNPEEN